MSMSQLHDLSKLPEGVKLMRDGRGWYVEAECFDYFAGGDTPEDAISRFRAGLQETIFYYLLTYGTERGAFLAPPSNNIFIVIWEDSHAETTADPFTTESAAIEWARARAREFDRFGLFAEPPVSEEMRRDGWRYRVNLGEDGARLRVVEKRLRGAT